MKKSKEQEPKGQNPSNKKQKEIPSDVLGSYTGMTIEGERPIQDADDL